jgi:1,4-dihydroxy-6-naphthoate synthase
MFGAMLHGRVDTEGLQFDVTFADIEQLNERAISGVPDVTKLSSAVIPQIITGYKILDSGSALGRGNGPLLVSRKSIDTNDGALKIAVPGIHTTANMLMSKLYPTLTDKTPILFSEIAETVASGRFDCGVLIHEGRFTYRNHGLTLIADLGKGWEQLTGMPLPLGNIAISERIDADIRQAVCRVLRRSVLHAMQHPDECMDFVRSHAQEMDDDVMRSHIALFVNEYSVSLGAEGRKAVSEFTGLDDNIFVNG